MSTNALRAPRRVLMQPGRRAALAVVVPVVIGSGIAVAVTPAAQAAGPNWDPMCKHMLHTANGKQSLMGIARSQGVYPSQILQTTWACHFGTLNKGMVSYIDRGNFRLALRKGTWYALEVNGG